jgi:hypothetical protein
MVAIKSSGLFDNNKREIFDFDAVRKNCTSLDDPAYGFYHIYGTVKFERGAFWIFWEDGKCCLLCDEDDIEVCNETN